MHCYRATVVAQVKPWPNVWCNPSPQEVFIRRAGIQRYDERMGHTIGTARLEAANKQVKEMLPS